MGGGNMKCYNVTIFRHVGFFVIIGLNRKYSVIICFRFVRGGDFVNPEQPLQALPT